MSNDSEQTETGTGAEASNSILQPVVSVRPTADATRDEVIEWCIKHKVDFTKPKFPPPSGWMWADTEVPAKCLTAIFTNTEDEDIESVDVLFTVAAQAH